MSLSQVAVALIRHPEEGEKRWLTMRDPHRQQFQLITAQRLEQESFRDCLDREIAWRLRLRRKKDYIISSMARLHLELREDAEPVVNGIDVIQFITVNLYGRLARLSVSGNRSVAWFSATEILSGRGTGGCEIDTSLNALLSRHNILGPVTT